LEKIADVIGAGEQGQDVTLGDAPVMAANLGGGRTGGAQGPEAELFFQGVGELIVEDADDGGNLRIQIARLLGDLQIQSVVLRAGGDGSRPNEIVSKITVLSR
jgi:hypothetical protein